VADFDRHNIAQNLKILESLKVQLLAVTTELFSGLYRGMDEQVVDALSSAIIILMSISSRVGISHRRLDRAVEEKLKERIENPKNSLRDMERELLAFWLGKGSRQ